MQRFSTLQQVDLSSVVTLNAYFIASYKIVKTGTSCNPITSVEECQQAARELDLDTTANEIHEDGKVIGLNRKDRIPYCYHKVSYLFFNENYASTVACGNPNKKDWCICKA